MLAALHKKCLSFRLKHFNEFVASKTKTSEDNGLLNRTFQLVPDTRYPMGLSNTPPSWVVTVRLSVFSPLPADFSLLNIFYKYHSILKHPSWLRILLSNLSLSLASGCFEKVEPFFFFHKIYANILLGPFVLISSRNRSAT